MKVKPSEEIRKQDENGEIYEKVSEVMRRGNVKGECAQ